MSLNYITYKEYLSKRYGKSAYRVGIDAGFSCPNRENGRSSFGCTFCEGAGARAAYVRNEDGSYPEDDNFLSINVDGYPENYNKDSVNSQIDRGLVFLKKRYKAEIFLLYIQAYSGTHANTKILKEIYDHALSCGNFSELVVSTRPDCLDKEKVDLLASYQTADLDVWCELGLQTIHDKTLDFINRGHTYADFLSAYELLESANVKTAVHLIFGLPGEDFSHIEQTIKEINRLKPAAIKIHNLHIPKDTPMYQQYLDGEVKAYEYEDHIENCIKAIELLDDDIVIMRFTCDVMRGHRGAPENVMKKGEFLHKLHQAIGKK